MHPSPAPRLWRGVAVALVLLVLALIGLRWDATAGWTSLIRFGETFADSQLPEVRALPVAIAPGTGYDGQFYAQLAVSPDPRRPELAVAVPNPEYRARRMLLPWLAHVLGGGRPWPVLQVYALLNVACWVMFAWWWGREVGLTSGQNLARWAAAVLALGTLDSVRLALTDLPATLFILLGVRALVAGRPWLAALSWATGGLTRETALLGLAGAWSRVGRSWRTVAIVVSAVVPLVGWSVWLHLHLAPAPSNAAGNFDWPGFAWARHLLTCAREISHGNVDSRYTFGLLGALGLAWQSMYVLSRWRDPDPWLRAALPFALLFWLLGDFVWHGYWAVARVCLPLTVIYSFRAPLGPVYFAANLTVLHGLYRLLPDL